MTHPDSATTERRSPEERLSASIDAMQKVFGQDFTLVQQAAAEHGVMATRGTLSTPLSQGDYNQRLPSKEDISSLLNAEIMLIQCMDRRTSYDHAKDMGADISVSMAGGGAQPDNNRPDNIQTPNLRRKTLVEFISSVYETGVLKKMVLSGHDGVCGGLNYLTLGQAAMKNQEGHVAEHQFVSDYLTETALELVAAGIPEDAIELTIAKVSGDHGHESYVGKTSVI